MSEEFRGSIGAMSTEEMNDYLSGDVLARLAVLKPDGAPYVVPVWFQWDGERMWFVGRERSDWCRYIEEDGRAAVVIDLEHRPPDGDPGGSQLPKVFMEGVASVVERPITGGRWVEIASEMADRYLGPNGSRYLEPTLNQPRWLIKFEPTVVKTWRGVGWAKKYWVTDSGGPSYEEAHFGPSNI